MEYESLEICWGYRSLDKKHRSLLHSNSHRSLHRPCPSLTGCVHRRPTWLFLHCHRRRLPKHSNAYSTGSTSSSVVSIHSCAVNGKVKDDCISIQSLPREIKRSEKDTATSVHNAMMANLVPDRCSTGLDLAEDRTPQHLKETFVCCSVDSQRLTIVPLS